MEQGSIVTWISALALLFLGYHHVGKPQATMDTTETNVTVKAKTNGPDTAHRPYDRRGK